MKTIARYSIAACVLAIFCLYIAWWRSGAGAVAAETGPRDVAWSESRLWVLRLRPGDDLVDSIMKFASERSIRAGAIVTCVGSLDRARLRFANQREYDASETRGQHFEIVSLVGTFSTADHHLHLSLANENGEMFGGHASTGNKVYTTAEIVIVEGLRWEFRRETDSETGYRELSPARRTDAAPR